MLEIFKLPRKLMKDFGPPKEHESFNASSGITRLAQSQHNLVSTPLPPLCLWPLPS
jgi:hypothetical protein